MEISVLARWRAQGRGERPRGSFDGCLESDEWAKWHRTRAPGPEQSGLVIIRPERIR